ncbi:MAG: DMT family transporter [Candidatus Nanohaloarchaea archaeon]|nr:DMT family transporter [Candidatus Nanohaloarchaea archaeon]
MALSLAVVLGLIAMVCYGVADFFVARATQEARVFDVLLWSKVVSVTLLGGALMTVFRVPSVSGNTAVLVVIAGLLNVAAYLAFYRGIQVGKLSLVSPVASAWGAVTAIIGVVVLGEVLMSIQAAAIGVVVAGTVLASFRWKDLRGLRWKNYEVGIEHGAVALFSWGVSFAIINVLVGRMGWLPAVFAVLAVLLLAMAGYGMAAGRELSPPEAYRPVLLIGVAEAIAYVALGTGLARFEAALVAPLAAAFPMVTVLLASLFLEEPLDSNQWAGILAIIAGVVVLSL